VRPPPAPHRVARNKTTSARLGEPPVASALEDSDTPLWLRTADTSTLAIPSNLGQPPQDAYRTASAFSSATAADSDYWAELDRLRSGGASNIQNPSSLPPLDVVERSPGYVASRLTKEGLGEKLGSEPRGIFGQPTRRRQGVG